MSPSSAFTCEENVLFFLTGEMASDEFEMLVFSCPELEQIVGEALYLDMISTDYRSGYDAARLRDRLLAWAKKTYGIKELDEQFLRIRVVQLCKAFLSEQLGVIEVSRRLSRVYWGAREERDEWEQIRLFIGIDSMTDHLPVEPDVRARWNREALEQKDGEIRQAEAYYQADVLEACTKLLQKYRA